MYLQAAVPLSKAGRSCSRERRGAARWSSRRPCLVRLEDFPRAPASRGDVLEISRTGPRVLLPLRLPVETLITIAPVGWYLPPTFTARVRHFEPWGLGWLHGCEFVQELDEQQLRLWLPWAAG